MILDVRTLDTTNMVKMMSVVSHIREPAIKFEDYFNKTVEFMLQMEASNTRYYVSTAAEDEHGVHATIVKCTATCLSSPSFN